MARESFAIGGVRIRSGTVRALELPITRLVTGADVTLPVRVVHGREDGPRIWIDAAIHGDEVAGVEVVRQVMAGLDPKTFRGTLVAVPIVNVLGFMTGDRYLPDRRDLNRSFPGSAARVARQPDRPPLHARDRRRCEVRHRPAHRLRPPQQPPAGPRRPRRPPHPRAGRRLRRAGDAARAAIRDGSLRHAAGEHGAKVLLYEAGEPLRFDDYAVSAGVIGVRRVLAALGMTEPVDEPPVEPSLECRSSGWVRARRTGILHLDAHLGPEGQRRRAARHPLRLLRQDPARGLLQPRRHRDRPDRGPAGQLR